MFFTSVTQIATQSDNPCARSSSLCEVSSGLSAMRKWEKFIYSYQVNLLRMNIFFFCLKSRRLCSHSPTQLQKQDGCFIPRVETHVWLIAWFYLNTLHTNSCSGRVGSQIELQLTFMGIKKIEIFLLPFTRPVPLLIEHFL